MTNKPNARNDFHTLYSSRNHELVIAVHLETKEIKIIHDLKIEEVPKMRVRAITTLQEKLPELDNKIKLFAPGAKTRILAEIDRNTIINAVKAIKEMWPEEQFGPEPPTAERVDTE